MEIESEPKLLRVIGGGAEGVIAPAKAGRVAIAVDPSGHGPTDAYEVRPLHVDGSDVDVLVLTTLSDEEAVRRYLALLEKDADAKATARE